MFRGFLFLHDGNDFHVVLGQIVSNHGDSLQCKLGLDGRRRKRGSLASGCPLLQKSATNLSHPIPNRLTENRLRRLDRWARRRWWNRSHGRFRRIEKMSVAKPHTLRVGTVWEAWACQFEKFGNETQFSESVSTLTAIEALDGVAFIQQTQWIHNALTRFKTVSCCGMSFSSITA